MSLEASKKQEQEQEPEPIIIEIADYENIEVVLSKMIVTLTEVIGASRLPDVYVGYEKIPFERRDPVYKSIMREEFKGVMDSFIEKHTL